MWYNNCYFISKLQYGFGWPSTQPLFESPTTVTGVDQVLEIYQATLHYQMAYGVQNHAFDLGLPLTNDTLLITVDTNQRATCTHVPW